MSICITMKMEEPSQKYYLLECLKFGPMNLLHHIPKEYYLLLFLRNDKDNSIFFVSAGQQFLMVFNPLTRIKIKKYQQKNNIRVKIIWNGSILEQKVFAKKSSVIIYFPFQICFHNVYLHLHSIESSFLAHVWFYDFKKLKNLM